MSDRELDLAGCRLQVEADRLDAPPRDRRLGQGPAPLSPFRAKDPRIDHPDQPGEFVDLDLEIARFAAWLPPDSAFGLSARFLPLRMIRPLAESHPGQALRAVRPRHTTVISILLQLGGSRQIVLRSGSRVGEKKFVRKSLIRSWKQLIHQTGKFHKAMTSSRTKWRRMSRGASPSSK